MATVEELQNKIAAAQRYIANMAARGEDRFVQGAQNKLAEYQSQLAPLLKGGGTQDGFAIEGGVNPDPKMAITGEELLKRFGVELPPGVDPNNVDPNFFRSPLIGFQPELPPGVDPNNVDPNFFKSPLIGFQPEPRAGQTQIETMPQPAPTGNVAVDQSNTLSSILNSPLYTEAIKGSYLTEWLPGLTKSIYDVNAARARELQANFSRQQAQADAIRQIAGNYAARGMRTPEMIKRGFAPVQQATEAARSQAEADINQMVAEQDVLYGAGAGSLDFAGKTPEEIQSILTEKFGGTFIQSPTQYGSIGAGARRSALGQLQQLPTQYGLTQVEKAPTSPLTTPEPGSAQTPAATQPTMTREQLQTKIDAAKRYISNMQARGEDRFVQGATKKLEGYQSQLASLGGF